MLGVLTLSSATNIAIGLLTVFIAGSLVVSGITEGVAKYLGTRSKLLWRTIHQLVDGPGTAMLRPGEPGDSGLGDSITNAIYASPFVNEVRRLDHKKRTLISEIESSAFARGLLHALVPDRKDKDQAAVIEGAVEAVPALAPAKGVLADLASEAVGSVASVREGVETWFDTEMERLSRAYRKRVRWWALLFGLLVAIGANVDVVHVVQTLNRDPVASKAAAAAGEDLYKSCKGKTDSELTACLSKGTTSLPIGWGDPTHRDWSPLEIPWTQYVGWALAALAFMQGAPFWFDVLGRITGLRSRVST